jgi:hypothetical protein
LPIAWNPSSQWIPIKAPQTAGAQLTYRPQAFPLYGVNGSSSYPIKCDASGNLVTGGAASGDLSGNYPGPTVAKLLGVSIPAQFVGFHGNSSGVAIPLAKNWTTAASTILCDDGNGNITTCISNSKFGSYYAAWDHRGIFTARPDRHDLPELHVHLRFRLQSHHAQRLSKQLKARKLLAQDNFADRSRPTR